MQVDFYHLTAVPLDRALPQIAAKVVAGGGRLLIVAADGDERQRIDRLLWSYAPESFLPHAQQGGDHDADQPVLIAGEATAAANGARHVALVDGTWRDTALEFDRAFHFFDDDRIAEARAAWRALATREGIVRNYWRQDDGGRWERVPT